MYTAEISEQTKELGSNLYVYKSWSIYVYHQMKFSHEKYIIYYQAREKPVIKRNMNYVSFTCTISLPQKFQSKSVGAVNFSFKKLNLSCADMLQICSAKAHESKCKFVPNIPDVCSSIHLDCDSLTDTLVPIYSIEYV